MRYRLITPIVGYASCEVEADSRQEAIVKSRDVPPRILEVSQLLDASIDAELCEMMLEHLEGQCTS